MTEEVEQTEATLPPREERDFVVEEDLKAAPERPEWLPEKYKTPEDLAKAYKELESKLGTKEEDLRNKFMEEIQAEAFKDRPEKVGDYELPDNFSQEATNDEFFQWWANHSFENGYGQAEFAKGLEMFEKAVSQTAPDFDAEMKKLGDNANARVEAAALFARQFFPEEQMPAVERLTETAEGLMALELVMSKLKSPSVNSTSNSIGQVTLDELTSMMKDERYWNQARRDPNFVKQVNEGFQRLHNS